MRPCEQQGTSADLCHGWLGRQLLLLLVLCTIPPVRVIGTPLRVVERLEVPHVVPDPHLPNRRGHSGNVIWKLSCDASRSFSANFKL